MALFSDIDWIIIAGVAGFLLFGRENRGVLRMLGRWYGRAMRLKQELLEEFSRAAEISPPTAGTPWSIRSAILEVGSPTGRTRGVPAAVRVPPVLPVVPLPPGATFVWTGGGPQEGWSMSSPAPPVPREEVP